MIFESSDDPLIRRLSTDSDDEEEEEKPLKQINQYLRLKKIGQGSFAKVFFALDTSSGRGFALKQFKLRELQHKEAGVSQLEREISAMRKIVHRNIIGLHEVLHVEATDTVYLVLDFADCGSLEDTIRLKFAGQSNKDNRLVKYAFKQVLAAVKHLHTHGIIHQDIKPSNILLNSDGKVYLSDFGVGHSFSSAEMVVGSPGYQAPEAISQVYIPKRTSASSSLKEFDLASYLEEEKMAEKVGENILAEKVGGNILDENSLDENSLDENSLDEEDFLNPAEEDIWSLGVTLFQAIFGRLPFKGCSLYEIVQEIRSKPLKIPEEQEQDQELVNLLKGMLCPNPAFRMTLDEVINSSFFDSVPDTMEINQNCDFSSLNSHNFYDNNKSKKNFYYDTNQKFDVDFVHAKVCDAKYSFARPSLTSCNMIRMLSCDIQDSLFDKLKDSKMTKKPLTSVLV